MKIYIPTYGRSDNQVTWENLPYEVKERTTLVVQDREEGKYDESKYDIQVLPPKIQSIGKTRQWIIENSASRHVLMLDDDLDFATRRADDPTKFRPSTDSDTRNMLRTLEHSLLEGFKLVGVSGREGANRDTSQFKEATRQLRVHAIDTQFFGAHNIRFDRLEFMEDFDVTLQLLELGYPNRVLNGWVHNQRGGSNAPGGCSESRTMAKQSEAAYELHKLHPKFVTVVRKSANNWGDEWRTDVRIQWKKAYESALKSCR